MEFVFGLWVGVPIGFVLCALLSGAKASHRVTPRIRVRVMKPRSQVHWPHSVR